MLGLAPLGSGIPMVGGFRFADGTVSNIGVGFALAGGLGTFSGLLLMRRTPGSTITTGRLIWNCEVNATIEHHVAFSGTAGLVEMNWNMATTDVNYVSNTNLFDLTEWQWFLFTINTAAGAGAKVHLYRRRLSGAPEIIAMTAITEGSGSPVQNASMRVGCNQGSTSSAPMDVAYCAFAKIETSQIAALTLLGQPHSQILSGIGQQGPNWGCRYFPGSQFLRNTGNTIDDCQDMTGKRNAGAPSTVTRINDIPRVSLSRYPQLLGLLAAADAQFDPSLRNPRLNTLLRM